MKSRQSTSDRLAEAMEFARLRRASRTETERLRAAAQYKRWGTDEDHPHVPRSQISVSKPLADEFRETFPDTILRAAADWGIRHAIDHADIIRSLASPSTPTTR